MTTKSGSGSNSSSVRDGVKRTLSKRPAVALALPVGLILIALDIAGLVLHGQYFDFVGGWQVMSLVAAILTLVWIYVDVLLYTEKHDPYRHLHKARPRLARVIIAQIFLYFNLLCVIATVVDVASQYVGIDPEYYGTNWRKIITIMDCVTVVVQAIFCMMVCQLIWWPTYRAAQSLMLVGGFLNVVVGMLMLVMNYQTVSPLTRAKVTYYLIIGGFVVASGILSMVLGSCVSEKERLNVLLSRLINVYITVLSICSILQLAYFAISLRAVSIKISGPNDSTNGDFRGIVANPSLSGISLVLSFICILASTKIQALPKSRLSVELFDFSKLTQPQRDAYAHLIDIYGRQYPGSPSGQMAMSLMKAYSEATDVPGLSFQALRVYQPEVKESEHDNFRRWAFFKYMPQHSYDEIKAWRNLDREDIIPEDDRLGPEQKSAAISAAGRQSQEKLVGVEEGEKLSKNQMKRLQKKAMKGKKGDKHQSVQFPLEPPRSAEELEREVEFHRELMATEAIVLLTKVESYDLTATLKGPFGRIARRLLGSDSYFKLLCVRMGLLAFHWPFRQSTFYTGPTKRPVARSAALLRAITEWNETLPRRERCEVHLDPKYEHDVSGYAITPSGWHPIDLPASHIIDLRPYKGKTLAEYLKAIKYRNQAAAFNRANGQIIETTDFSDENCEQAMQLWQKIAEKRTGEGRTSVLADPTVSLLKSLGTPSSNEQGHRSLLFLKVDDKVIASCVLFRLGQTITSDLQGLDHDLARQYKAYFVMMQHTIQIALKEERSFVDFGPTTSKPKQDIGAKDVPLKGAIHVRSSILNLGVKFAAKGVDSG